MPTEHSENQSTETSTINTVAFTAFAQTMAQGGKDKWRQSWAGAANLGILSSFMPKTFGGSAMTATEFVDLMITFGRCVPDNGLTMGLNSHVWTIQQPLVRFGTPKQHDYLSDLASGAAIGAFALTEKAAGSDALAMETRAVKKDGGYVLNGAKTLVGMGPVCDLALVFAKTAPEHGNWGISAFLVEAADAGFEQESETPKLGLTTLPLGPLRFKDCWIPEDRRLGAEGSGAQIIQAVLEWERCFILAPHIGAMARQLEECFEFARSRVVFDRPVSDFQSVSNRLADMRVRLETCQLIIERAAQMYDSGAALTQYAAMVNLHVSEAFLESSLDALRNFGGLGYLSGSQVGENVKDALGGVIYSGTSDVQRQIIAKMERPSRTQK